MNSNLSRRSVLKLMAGSGMSVLFTTGCSSLRKGKSSRESMEDISPIERGITEPAPLSYSGDDPTTPHQILWVKDAFAAERRAEADMNVEKAPLVIIGGGMSGLLSAYLLREHRPIVLEQAGRFGGNSKGQSYRGIDYSIGAAYFIKPDAGSAIEALYEELQLSDFTSIKPASNPLLPEGARSVAHSDQQTKLLSAYLLKVLEGEELAFPEIPAVDDEGRAYINELDGQSFRAHLESIAGGKLNRFLDARIEHYCWSSFGASASEVSAAAGLNFFAAEFSDICVSAGGNSAVAERVLERLHHTLPAGNLRPRSLVYDVIPEPESVRVVYLGADGKAHTIIAKSVIFSCPKFIAAKLLRDIEPARLDAIRQLRYRSYLVANVCLNTPPRESFYDKYLENDYQVALSNVRAASEHQKVTDVVLANFASRSRKSSVLTLYRGIPYDGARIELYAPDSYDRIRREFESQVSESILPALGFSEKNMRELRVARWGHPLPLAQTGLFANQVVDKLFAPFQSRIFFVEQDNWALPAFETAAMEAIRWAPQIDRFLRT